VRLINYLVFFMSARPIQKKYKYTQNCLNDRRIERTHLNNNRVGQAALSLVLLVGGAVVMIGLTLIFLVFSFINASFGFRAANQALGVAISGANDALLQLARDKDFPGSDWASGVTGYYADVDDYVAYVSVSRSWSEGSITGAEYPNSPEQALIVSKATVSNRTRTVRVLASVSHDGKIDIISLEQSISPGSGFGS